MEKFIRNDWTLPELLDLHHLPLLQLISRAHFIHAQFHAMGDIQICTLISVKTGGCIEDCAYCAQSSHYRTSVKPQPMMTYEEVLNAAKKAKERGATRICLGAAWREVREGHSFEEILRMIKAINVLGIEVCCTLGMLKDNHAKRLKEAGLYAYNHNLDSSENFYRAIITTRSYQERLNTLKIVRNVGLTICCGGILGMGETVMDRLELLLTLSRQQPHPESVPLNRLSPIPGTPLENQPLLSIWEFIRMVALTRIVLPKAKVRLSSGRGEMSHEQQTLCFLAGANSIFMGEKLLTVPNAPIDEDEALFQLLGMKKCLPFQ